MLQTEALPQLLRELKQNLCNLKPGYPQALPGILAIKKSPQEREGFLRTNVYRSSKSSWAGAARACSAWHGAPASSTGSKTASGSPHGITTVCAHPHRAQDTKHNALSLTFNHTLCAFLSQHSPNCSAVLWPALLPSPRLAKPGSSPLCQSGILLWVTQAPPARAVLRSSSAR